MRKINKSIRGITVTIGGETSGLEKALKDVNKQSYSLQTELNAVQRSLKFNPDSVELLRQKQELLTESIQATTKKLDGLKEAEAQVEAQFKKGDIKAHQYREFKRELEKTENQLGNLKSELGKVNAGAPLKDLKKDADDAKGAVNDLGGEVAGLAAGLAAGGGLAGTITQALDISSLNTKIDVSFEVPPESINAVKEAVKGVETYGIDAEAALEGVRRQWALNKDASDATNQAVIKGAATIAASYAGIDFNELIQETNEIAKALNISNEEALGLTNSLLKTGFPPEQLDIIAEYGTQLKTAGYNAQEIQALFAAGIDTGTWNIDNLMDGLKEGRIRAAEFGQEVPKALQELIKGTDISSKQLQTWGQSVAKGGEEGSAAMTNIAKALNGVEDETKKNLLGVQIFGTIYEDQGQNIIDTLINAQTATVDLKTNQDLLNESTAKLDASPAVQLQQAFTDMKIALEPLMLVLADFVTKISEWVSQNPQLTATIVAVTTALAILIGLGIALAPIITAIAAAAGALNIAMLPLTGIILGVMAAIAALIAIGVLLYKNWDEIKAKMVEVWGSLSEWFATTLESIKIVFSNAWEGIKTYLSETWTSISESVKTAWESIILTLTTIWSNLTTSLNQIWENIKSGAVSVWESLVSAVITIITPFIDGATNLFNGMKSGIEQIFKGIQDFLIGFWFSIKTLFAGALLLIVDLVTGDFEALKNDSIAIWDKLKFYLEKMWSGLKDMFFGVISTIKGYFSAGWENIKSVTTTVFDAIRSLLSQVWENIKSNISSAVSNIKTSVSNAWESLKTITSNVWNGIKTTISNLWDSIKTTSTNTPEQIKNTVKEKFESLKTSVGEKMTATWEKIKEIWDKVMSFFKDIDLKQIGKDIINGLIDGITEKGKDLMNKAKEIAESIKKTLKNVLDINSPSRETQWMGQMLGDGFVKGMQQSMRSISAMSDKMAVAALPTMPKVSASAQAAPVNHYHTWVVEAGKIDEVQKVVRMVQGMPQASKSN